MMLSILAGVPCRHCVRAFSLLGSCPPPPRWPTVAKNACLRAVALPSRHAAQAPPTLRDKGPMVLAAIGVIALVASVSSWFPSGIALGVGLVVLGVALAVIPSRYP